MMYSKGKGWITGYGDGYTGHEGNGSGQSCKEEVHGYGKGCPNLNNTKDEEPSCIRLLTDDIEDVNFFICQSHILNNKKETK